MGAGSFGVSADVPRPRCASGLAAAGLPRRRDLAAALRLRVRRLAALLAVVVFLAADALGSGLQPIADALLRLRGVGVLLSRSRRSGRTRCPRARSARPRRCRRGGSRAAGSACSRPAAPRIAARLVEQLADDGDVLHVARDQPAGVERLDVASPAATPRLASVISRSTNGRSSFAFGTVVSMRSWRMSAVAWLRRSAMPCSLTRPSFRCAML